MTLEVQRPSDSPGVLRLILSNPPANATSIEDLRSIADTLENLSPDDHVVVVSARGKGFSAGGDSGSLIVSDGFLLADRRPVGLLFGGTRMHGNISLPDTRHRGRPRLLSRGGNRTCGQRRYRSRK